MKEDNISSAIYSGFTLDQPTCPMHLRLLAYAIDMGIIAAIIYALFVPASIAIMALISIVSALSLPSTLIYILSIIGVIAIGLLLLSINSYYFIRNELKSGATPGKKLLGLMVISIDGKKLNFRQCMYRDLMRLIDATLIIPGLLCMILNPQNRRIGDLAAGTMVIYLERNAKENDYFYIKQDEYNLFLDRLQPSIPDRETIAKYSSFALLTFVKNKPDREQSYIWDSIVRKYYTTDLGKKIDRETALIFFAEHCRQVQLKSSPNSNSNLTNNNTMEIPDGNAAI